MKRLLLPTLLILLSSLPSSAQLFRLDSLSLVQIDTLEAARIEAEKMRHEARTQTSMTRIGGREIARAVAPFGTPDLIKSLQLLPGVGSGTELMSGLYVRGGDGSDNLFLLDGVPMYQVSHVIGLFSSFNPTVIEDVEFYKGGFPARYGGKLSSVVDVGVREGDYQQYHGDLSIGAIDGHIQLEGPIVKGKTSFNLGIRRTWTDIVKSAASLFIKNESDAEMVGKSHYDFGDYNFKLAHKFSPDSKLVLSLYYGQDLLTAMMKMGQEMDFDLNFDLRWGNTLGTLRWEKKFSETLDMDVSAYYTQYSSKMKFDTYIRGKMENTGTRPQYYKLTMDEFNRSRIYDYGSNVNFYSKRFSSHSLRFGGSAIYHTYDPTRHASQKMSVSGQKVMDDSSSQDKHYLGGEIAAYLEDEISIGDKAIVNAGLRDVVFLVEGRARNRVEPRIAAKYFMTGNLSLKGSFSSMNQFTHQVAATYLDLPTNLWMPSTAIVKPMHSDQGVLGLAAKFPRNFSLDVECFYKVMNHIYEYTGANTMLPQIDEWESSFEEGKGRAYGAEFTLEWKNRWAHVNAYYTLSKSERLFKTFYYTWFPDRNDNRHRFTITGSARFAHGIEAFASWTYHSGNRFTGVSSVVWDEDGNDVGYNLYDYPNNYSMPAYHRLDVGASWHKKMRSGKEMGVNLSVYNAYCHINPMFGFVETQSDGTVRGVSYGLIPIIPTISYSYKF